MFRLKFASLTMLVGALLSGCDDTAPPLPLAHVDMARMYGAWHIIATLPNSFERGMIAPYDVYAKRPDGDIREDFYARWGGFDALVKHYVVHDWVRPNTNNGHWRVQIVWPIDLPFLVLYVDPQYRYVMFGENSRALGWIYARDAKLDDSEYQSILARFQSLGYDSSHFRKFVQQPGDLGAPGYWSDGITR